MGVPRVQGQHVLQQLLALLWILGEPGQLQPGISAARIRHGGRPQQVAGFFYVSLTGCEPARFENCGPAAMIAPDGSVTMSVSVAFPCASRSNSTSQRGGTNSVSPRLRWNVPATGAPVSGSASRLTGGLDITF